MSKVTCDMSMSVGGFVSGPNQSLENPFGEGLIDELRLHVAPVLLGAGDRLFDGVGDLALEPLGVMATNLVTHTSYRVAR